MKSIREAAKDIDVIFETDVIVVGGGPAGIGAALAAGRTGAKTVLIDRFGSLGGIQTQGLNPNFSFVDPELHSGIVIELLDRLKKSGGLYNTDHAPLEQRARMKDIIQKLFPPDKLPKRLLETETGYWGRWGWIFDIEAYKYLLDIMMQEAGVTVFFHSLGADVIREGNVLKGIIIQSKEGRKAILGKVVLDTTGEGDVIAQSGAARLGDEGVPAGPRKGEKYLGLLSCFYIGGVDMARFRAFKEQNKDDWNELYGGQKMIAKAKTEGHYILDRVEKLIVSEFHDVYNDGKIWIMTLLYRSEEPVTIGLSKGEMELRKQAHGIQKMFQTYVPGFENSYVDRTAYTPVIGGRYRLMGDYVMTVGDMREGKAFDDAIAISNMPPDLYEVAGRFGYEILPYDIPYRALVSRDIDNLMAAGTTISSGMFANGSLRYCTPTICAGVAAGTGAALAAKNNVTPRQLDVKLLQKTLRQAGAKVSVNDLSAKVLEPYRFIKSLNLMFRRTQEEIIPESEIAKY